MLNFPVWLGVTSNGQILNFQRFFEAIKQILAFQIPFKRIGAALLAQQSFSSAAASKL